jgi:mannose-6-phosphate isomerase-like protein (cupin superfamily)
MEVWLVTLPPGAETPANEHYGETVIVTLQGTERAMVDGDSLDLFPNTTLVIPARAYRQFVNTGEENLVSRLTINMVIKRPMACRYKSI